MKDTHRKISRWKTSGGVRAAPPVTFLSGSTCPPRRECACVVPGVAQGGAPSRPREGEGSASRAEGRMRLGGSA